MTTPSEPQTQAGRVNCTRCGGAIYLRPKESVWRHRAPFTATNLNHRARPPAETEIGIILGHVEVYGVALLSEHDGHDPKSSSDYWLDWLRLRLRQFEAEARAPLEAEIKRLRRLLSYLWDEADVEPGQTKVCDLFAADDPLALDIPDALGPSDGR